MDNQGEEGLDAQSNEGTVYASFCARSVRSSRVQSSPVVSRTLTKLEALPLQTDMTLIPQGVKQSLTVR